MHKRDFEPEGFEWVSSNDWERGIISLLRKSDDPADSILIVCNFMPIVRDNYKVGVLSGGFWEERLNSDAKVYGGSGQGNLGGVEALHLPSQGPYYSLSLKIPPLAVLYFKRRVFKE